MRLKDLGNLIVFDEFPLLFEPKQKIILTHLLHLEKQTLPEKLPMIFTTQKLAGQLKKYCEATHRKCVNKSNIVIVKPYEFIDIVLERRLTLQILFCTSEADESNNVLLLIRQNGKLNFMYGGNYTDFRAAVFNDTFATWITHGVEKLYVNLKRMEESHTFSDIDQMQKVFQSVEDITKFHQVSKIHIYLPLFGFEHFILKLSQYLPKRIKVSNLSQFYMTICNDDPDIAVHFIKDSDETDERIILLPGEESPYEANIKFKEKNYITINICDDAANCKNYEMYNDDGYYQLFYSPEPSPFQLKLLCMLVKPYRIFGIIDTFNNKSVVPKYLYELCVGVREKIIKNQERQNNSLCSSDGKGKQQVTTIIGGVLANDTNKISGLYISDTESDDDDDVENANSS